MSYNGNPKHLLRAADELERKINELPTFHSPADDLDASLARARRYRNAAEALAAELRQRADPRASISGADHSTLRMSMLGVRASSTGGLTGLFRNWIAAARRKAAE